MDEQPIFVSWSKAASKAAAEAFRDHLPELLPGVKPWMSSLDITKGRPWFAEISEQLRKSRACLLIITPENVGSAWLYYEAGAVAHALDGNHVITFLLGVSPGELSATPLGQYQATEFNKDDTKRLVQALNNSLESPVQEPLLSSAFDGVWPKLYRKLTKIAFKKPAEPGPSTPSTPPALSDEAVKLLLAATAGKQHKIYVNDSQHGQNVSAGDQSFLENSKDGRQNALFLGAVQELTHRGLIEDGSGKGQVYSVTTPGYSASDEIKKSLPPELSEEAKQILLGASAGKDGQVMGSRTFEGFYLSAGGTMVCQSDDDRIVAEYEHALEVLVGRGYLRIEGEDNYQITPLGYKAAKQLAPPPPPVTDEGDIQVLLHGWMHKKFHNATRTPPVNFEEVDRELNLQKGSAAKFLERAAEKLNWVTDSKGATMIVFRRSRISSG